MRKFPNILCYFGQATTNAKKLSKKMKKSVDKGRGMWYYNLAL